MDFFSENEIEVPPIGVALEAPERLVEMEKTDTGEMVLVETPDEVSTAGRSDAAFWDEVLGDDLVPPPTFLQDAEARAGSQTAPAISLRSVVDMASGEVVGTVAIRGGKLVAVPVEAATSKVQLALTAVTGLDALAGMPVADNSDFWEVLSIRLGAHMLELG